MRRIIVVLFGALTLGLGGAAAASAQDASDAGNGGDGSLISTTGDVSVGYVTGDNNEVTVLSTVGPLNVDASGGDDNDAVNLDVEIDDRDTEIVDDRDTETIDDRDTDIRDSAIIRDGRVDDTYIDAGDDIFDVDEGRDRRERDRPSD